MLEDILHDIKLESPDARVVLMLDDGIADNLKWKLDVQFVCPIVSVSEVDFQYLNLYKPDSVILFSQYCIGTILKLLEILSKLSCLSSVTVLTTFSPTSALLSLRNSVVSSLELELIDDAYDYISSRFKATLLVSVKYVPVHVIDVVSPLPQLHIFGLSSIPLCKHFKTAPMMLTDLSSCLSIEDSSDVRVNSISDVTADMLPASYRSHLKGLTHEVACALVNDIGINPIDKIFVRGKTSSLLGHTLQSVLHDTKEQADAEGGLLKRRCNVVRKGTLLLVDRSIDMATPLSHQDRVCSSCSLAHRVVSSLPRLNLHSPYDGPGSSCSNDADESRTYKGTDDAITSQTKEAQIDFLSSPIRGDGSSVGEPAFCLPTCDVSLSYGSSDAFHEAFSALQGLPKAVQIVPTLAPSNSVNLTPMDAGIDSVRNSFLSESEEDGKKALIEALRKVIRLEKDSVPPVSKKKRGVGTEVLGLLQLLIQPVDQNLDVQAQRTWLASLCQRHLQLISLCLCVVESFQRSSTKQFSTVFPIHGGSFEQRCNREATLINLLNEGKDDSCLEFLETLLCNATDSCALKSNTPTSSPTAWTSVDLGHWFLLLQRYILRSNSISSLSKLVSSLSSYVLLASPAEELLANAHYIPSTITKLILQWRQVASPGNGNETLQESISAEILKCLARMEEFRELQHLECNTANSTNVKSEVGFLAQSVSTVLNHGTPSSPSTCNVDSTSKADVMGIEALGYYHVPPEQSLMELAASAGIGLVQQGLGSLFGFSMPAVESPVEDAPVTTAVEPLVVIVVGDLSFLEVQQIRRVCVAAVEDSGISDIWVGCTGTVGVAPLQLKIWNSDDSKCNPMIR